MNEIELITIVIVLVIGISIGYLKWGMKRKEEKVI